jgi:hypothetical protein
MTNSCRFCSGIVLSNILLVINGVGRIRRERRKIRMAPRIKLEVCLLKNLFRKK